MRGSLNPIFTNEKLWRKMEGNIELIVEEKLVKALSKGF